MAQTENEEGTGDVIAIAERLGELACELQGISRQLLMLKLRHEEEKKSPGGGPFEEGQDDDIEKEAKAEPDDPVDPG